MSAQRDKCLRMARIAMIMSGKYDTGTYLVVYGVNEYAEPIKERISQIDSVRLEKDLEDVARLLAL